MDGARVLEQRERDEFFWLDLEDPTAADLEALGEVLGLHPVAIEDTLEFGQRPKVDIYDDHVLVIFYTARASDRMTEPIEVHVYVAGGYVITVRRATCMMLDRLHDA